jgi:hypothetical protein
MWRALRDNAKELGVGASFALACRRYDGGSELSSFQIWSRDAVRHLSVGFRPARIRFRLEMSA